MEHSYVSAFKLDYNKLKKFSQGRGWEYVCKIKKSKSSRLVYPPECDRVFILGGEVSNFC